VRPFQRKGGQGLSRLPESRDVVLNELRVRLHRAARDKDVPEIERYARLIEQIVDELGESMEQSE
jgi:hypothetical protein